MNGIWVGISTRVGEADIGDLLRRWFPELEVLTHAAAFESARPEWAPIVFSVEDRPNIIDFPTFIDFDCFPGPDDDAVNVGAELARRFASEFGCRSVCDGSGYGDDASPYWSIVWSGGKSHLADDCESAFADGEGGLIELVRETFSRSSVFQRPRSDQGRCTDSEPASRGTCCA